MLFGHRLAVAVDGHAAFFSPSCSPPSPPARRHRCRAERPRRGPKPFRTTHRCLRARNPCDLTALTRPRTDMHSPPHRGIMNAVAIAATVVAPRGGRAAPPCPTAPGREGRTTRLALMGTRTDHLAGRAAETAFTPATTKARCLTSATLTTPSSGPSRR